MGTFVGRRTVIFCCFAVLISAGQAQAAVEQPAAWATPSIRAVTAAGLLGAKDVRSFRAADPLTAQALENLVFDLKARLTTVPEAGDPGNEPNAPVPAPVPAPPVTDPTTTDPTATTVTTTTTTTVTTPVPPPTPKQVANPNRP